ncbi:unnamed protein product [Triticum turgidum subsp. durum]|uniref:Arp2/3 complex 34 kDa subunit n=1 Tax=Triticum turgidum subsp. durum TaxID=4567 RepID=A0A9R1PUN8_TRITD|nr:unnamed protein product [Triticum turgidum subsp. durum]
MAFFNGGSRALVEILTRFQSSERPMPVDHTFFELGSVRYHVQASASDPENVYLSISTPSLFHEASTSTCLPEFTLQEVRKMYHKFAEIVEPAREGYALTLKLNFSGLTRPKDRARAVRQVSLLQSIVLGSQLKHLLGSLGSSGATKLVYNHRDPFFVSRSHFPHAFPGRHGRSRRHLLLPGAAGRRELVREGAQVQLVGHPTTGAAGGVRAAPHHQRRLRLLRHLRAAREAEEGRQNGVDPAQLPGLRQVPHQVHPKLHSEQDEKAAGELGRGNPKCEAKGWPG